MTLRTLQIGKTSAGKRFTLPTEIGTQTTAVLGIRGSGKTVTATVIVEELLKRGQPVVVIDPVDVWWGLKSSLDGKEEGFPVVVLGDGRLERVDLPLAAENGPVLADFAVEHLVPLVLSLRHLRKNAQRSFVTGFAEQLYHRKGEVQHRTPLLVVIDEASTFVPQKVQKGHPARMVGAIEDLVRRGRSAGIGVCLIDQRPATVNKDVLTQLEVLVAHRVSSPQDTKALLEWVRLHDALGHEKEFLEKLPILKTGEAWFWAPALDVFDRIQVRMRETFDSSKTPKAGEAAAAPKKLADVDLDAIREQLESTIEEAEANDPKVLRRRIAQVEAELRKARKSASPPDPDLIRREVDRAVAAAEKSMGSRVHQLEGTIGKAHGATQKIADAAQQLLEVLHVPASNGSTAAAAHHHPRAPKARPARAPALIPRGIPRPDTEDLPDPQKRILDALSTLESIGVEAVSRTNLALFSRQSPKSSAYGAHIADLEKLGLLRYPAAGNVALTDAGRDLGRATFEISSAADLHRAWLEYLEPPQARILRVLLDEYPDDLARDELAERAGQSPRSSAYGAHVATLQQLGAVEYPSSGRVRATELLFPAGIR